jgi:hypothetical protein
MLPDRLSSSGYDSLDASAMANALQQKNQGYIKTYHLMAEIKIYKKPEHY